MELRRYKDLIAVKTGSQSRPVAFHARNMAVAEISEEAWQVLEVANLWSTENSGFRDPRSEAASELSEWEITDADDIGKDSGSFGIRSLTLNVTQVCNLHCTYCAAGGDGTYGDPVKKISIEKTLPQIKFFLDQVPRGERFHIAFLGGEPLLYPEAVEGIGRYVLDEAERRGLRASFKVTTNGTLINAKTLAALKAIKANVVVSIDGPQELHDRQRLTKSGQGSFTATLRGLLDLLDNREDLGRIGAHAVFNEKNLEVEKAWDFLSKFPVDDIEFTYSVAGADREATRVYDEGLARVAAKAWKKGGEDELLRIGAFRSIFTRLDARRQLRNHCGLGKSMAVIDSRNNLWNCPWTVGQAENKLGEGTDLDYDKIERHQASIIERNDCGQCWARFVCGGGCSFVHGSTDGTGKLDKKSDYCERTRFLIAQALVYYHLARASAPESQEAM